MHRNTGLITIALFTSHLLAGLRDSAAREKISWTCKNGNVTAIRVANDRDACHCLFVPQWEPKSYGEGYKYTPGIGAHKLHKEGKTWNEARKVCHYEGAHLAVVNSKPELELLNKMFEDEYRSIRGDSMDFAFLGIHTLFNKSYWAPVLGIWRDPKEVQPYDDPQKGECELDMERSKYQGNWRCGTLIRPCKYVGKFEHNCDAKLAFFCEKPDDGCP